jgi:hypothetical protein
MIVCHRSRKMIRCFFIAQLLSLGIAQKAAGQTESFDIVHYAAPKDWKKDTKPGVVIYTGVNQRTGGFCLIAIYSSVASAGNPQADFSASWHDLVLTRYQTEANPKTETQSSSNGWQAVVAAARVKQNGIDSYLIATVFSGFGKTATVLANFNDQAYAAQLQSFLGSINLDRPSPASGINQAIVTQSNGSAEKVGHLIYQPIKGWKLKKFASGAIFTPSDISPDHYLEVRILDARSFTGTMEQALAQSWDDACSQLQVQKTTQAGGSPYSNAGARRSFKGWEYISADGTVRNQNGNYEMHLFVIKLNNRIERIAAVGLINIQNGSFSPYANPLYRSAIDDFRFSVQFDDWKDPAVTKGALQGDGIAGFYEGLKLGGGLLSGSYALFFTNGQVFFGSKLPTQGFDGLNTWVDAETRSRFWGTYALQGGKGALKMGYGGIPLRVNGNELILTTQNTEHRYVKVPSVDGARFEGTYAFDGNWNGAPPSIGFTADGRFTDAGALNILNHQTTDPFNITRNPGSGTYEVRNFTIVFKYSDGRICRLAFSGQGFSKSNPSPEKLTLSFNDDELRKR